MTMDKRRPKEAQDAESSQTKVCKAVNDKIKRGPYTQQEQKIQLGTKRWRPWVLQRLPEELDKVMKRFRHLGQLFADLLLDHTHHGLGEPLQVFHNGEPGHVHAPNRGPSC